MSYLTQPQNSSRKMTAIGIAVVFHVLILYAMITGLATKAYHQVVDPIKTVNIKEPPPPKEKPPPPPEKLVEIPVVTPPPDVVVQNLPPPPNPITTTVTKQTYVAPPTTPIAPPQPPVAQPVQKALPVAASGATPKGNRKGWFTDEDYPESARRASEEGTTGVSLVINEQGRIDSCSVTSTSGSKALDDVTCRLFQRRGKYTPAKAEGGTPIKQTIADRVVWRLPKE